MNETLKTIANRTSIRSFQKEHIKENELNQILKAGIQAPSAMNRQLCEAFAIINPEIIDELAKALSDLFNQRGESKPEHYHFAYHAPVLVIVSGPEDDTRRVEDGSCMLENMFIAATSLGIGSCWINQLKDTQNDKNIRNILTKIGIPTHHQVVGCAALGYIQDCTKPKDKKESRIHIIS